MLSCSSTPAIQEFLDIPPNKCSILRLADPDGNVFPGLGINSIGSTEEAGRHDRQVASTHAMKEFYPSLTAVPLKDIPSIDEMLKVMVPMLEESETWTLGKIHENAHFKIKTQTFSRNKTPKDGAMWHGRVSDHPKEDIGGFEPFWNGIGVHHFLNEKEYYEELDKAKLLKKMSDQQEIWAVHFALKPPASNRLFTILIVTHVETDSAGLRTGYVMSIPIDVSSDPELSREEYNATRGTYSAIERVREMPDGSINWRMITTSTPGGYIPQFVVERSLPGKIAEDVPCFLSWLEKNPTGISAEPRA